MCCPVEFSMLTFKYMILLIDIDVKYKCFKNMGRLKEIKFLAD